MNIFILDYNVQTNAAMHVDKHVVKMPTEHVQMMNAVCDEYGLPTNMNVPKSVHSHPCTLWLKKSLANWHYLHQLTLALHDQWRIRYNHRMICDTHSAYDKMLQLTVPPLPKIELTQFAQALGSNAYLYQHEDTVTAYRRYFIGEKQHLANWKHGNIPYWWR